MSMPHQAAIRAGITLVVSIAACTASADVSLNAMFGDHMVLQQGIRNRIWGRADAGEQVTVTLGGQSHTATAGPDGAWHVMLDPVTAYGGPHTLTVKGKNTLTFNDVLIGEVWICSGQSNMQWSVNQSNDADLEKAAASYPQIRFISVPQVGTQDPQWTFSGSWQACSPETVGEFSAVGFYFGRQLHQTLGVPVGLIDNAWGGSAAEAWVRRDRLAGHPTLRAIHERWEGMEAGYEAEKAAYDASVKKWEEAAAKAKADGTQPPARPNPGANPEGRMRGNARPGNIHSGVLTPSIGYGIRGVIWYQGESNVQEAALYRRLLPLMIEDWRRVWGQGAFPFIQVQLANHLQAKDAPEDSAWASLRAAQTSALALPGVGMAVAIDVGEAADIHPKDKKSVGERLARWALCEVYHRAGLPSGPLLAGMQREAGGRLRLSFRYAQGLSTRDGAPVLHLAIADAKRCWRWAQSRIEGESLVVWHPDLSCPAAVRYAWADNPEGCNLVNGAGLPASPFDSDDL